MATLGTSSAYSTGWRSYSAHYSFGAITLADVKNYEDFRRAYPMDAGTLNPFFNELRDRKGYQMRGEARSAFNDFLHRTLTGAKACQRIFL